MKIIRSKLINMWTRLIANTGIYIADQCYEDGKAIDIVQAKVLFI